MITPSFSPTATERVLPKLALDFTTASLDSRVTFTRTTDATHPATYVNSSGYVASSSNNAPRFDYNPVTLACKGLLIEESRTNVITYSEDLRTVAEGGSGSWVASGAGQTIAFNQTSPANVANSAMTLTWLGSTGRRYFESSMTGNTSTACTAFVKYGNSQYVALQSLFSGGTSKDSYAVIDFTAGTVSVQGADAVNASASITAFPNGWYKISVSHTDTGSNTVRRWSIAPTASNGTTIISGGTVIVWGAQMETGAFPTSYIPTTSAALTRNADVATMTGTNFSSWYNQSEGTFVAQVDSASQRTGAFPAYFGVNDGTGNNAIGAYQAQTNGTTAEVLVSGSQTATFGATAYTNNTEIGIGLGYKLNNFGLSISGGNTLTDVSGTVPTVDRLQLGGHRNGNSIGTGHIYKFFYYPQKLTSNEIRAFSKL